MSNEELLLAYNNTNDQAYFNSLVSNITSELTAYLAHQVGWGDAPDLLQLTLMRLLKYRYTYNGTGRVLAWVYSIASRLVIDHKRRSNAKKRRHINGLEDWSLVPDKYNDDDLEPVIGTEETINQLQHHISNLTDGKRHVLESVYFGHCKLREAAKHLDIPLGTAKSRLHAGIAELRQRMRSM